MGPTQQNGEKVNKGTCVVTQAGGQVPELRLSGCTYNTGPIPAQQQNHKALVSPTPELAVHLSSGEKCPQPRLGPDPCWWALPALPLWCPMLAVGSGWSPVSLTPSIFPGLSPSGATGFGLCESALGFVTWALHPSLPRWLLREGFHLVAFSFLISCCNGDSLLVLNP